jgi:hypothetical protein
MGVTEIDLDEEAERAFQAALLAQGLIPDGGDGEVEEVAEEVDEEAERAWQAAQMEAMKSNSESGADDDDDSAERAFAAQKGSSKASIHNPFPPHWEGFISEIEKVWDITFSDIKFGEQIGVGTFS